MRLLPTLAVLLAASGLPPAAATAASAPGRTVFSVGAAQPVRNVDAQGASYAVALPDGGAVLLANESTGVVLAQITRDGKPNGAFGQAGIAHVAIDGPFSPLQMTRQPDGRLLVTGFTPARTKYELGRLTIVRLLPDGRLDPSFGQNGIAQPEGVQASCGGMCEPLSLQADGSIVVTGNTGSAVPGSEVAPGGPEPRFQWVVARLTPGGALDPGFGKGGIQEISGAVGGNGGGNATAVLGDGRIVALGRGPRDPLLTRLLPDGRQDPDFNGGTPVSPGLPYAFHMLVHGDGTVDVRGGTLIKRYRPDGTVDAAFGSNGSVTVPGPAIREGMIAAPDRSLIFYGGSTIDPHPVSAPDFVVYRIGPDGSFDPATGGATGRTVRMGFGGGLTSFGGGGSRPLPRLAQSGFALGRLVQRPDGTFLAAGGVRIVRYTGEGSGFSTGLFAAGSLTPLWTLEDPPAFGTAATPLSLRLTVPTERSSIAYRLRRVVVRIRMSSPGTALVKVRARGRVIAQSLEPVFAAGSTSARIRLTRTGERMLRSGRAFRIQVTATGRDVFAQTRTAAATGVLRRSR